MSVSPSLFESARAVDIDVGVFKYVLINMSDNRTLRARKLVRGYNGCEFHADVLSLATTRLVDPNITLNCVGGGRINHDAEHKKIHIYGYSQGFGRADHASATELCREAFGADYTLTWSDQGY
mmetsp:Transcript_59834/g.129721  ORF Transcript_59834/g.129721 Transcript_59834/m.129721 type:complete len:123 (+) Transcript_59834:294-662(+)